MQKSLEEGAVFPGREDKGVNLTDFDTSLVVTIIGSKVPGSDSGGGTIFDVLDVGFDSLDSLELPVGVSHGGFDELDLVVVSVSDIRVLGVPQAVIGILDSLSLVSLDELLDGREIFSLNGLDQTVGVVGEILVWLEASEDLIAEIVSGETHVNTGLELSWGGIGDRVDLESLGVEVGDGKAFHCAYCSCK